MRKMTFALALVLLLSCFLLAACGNESGTTSGTSSVTESSKGTSSAAASSKEASSADAASSAAETSSEETASSEPATSADTSADTSSAGTTSGSTTASEELKREGTNLALNCTVTGADLPTKEGTQNYSAKLTDGNASATASYDNAWFGYWWQADSASESNTKDGIGIATVDLGSVKDIKEVCVNLITGCTSGIITPKSVKFEYSEDGKTYTLIGEKAFEDRPADGDALTAAWYGFSMSETVKAQYVRVSIEVGGVWTFLNEIEVY